MLCKDRSATGHLRIVTILQRQAGRLFLSPCDSLLDVLSLIYIRGINKKPLKSGLQALDGLINVTAGLG